MEPELQWLDLLSTAIAIVAIFISILSYFSATAANRLSARADQLNRRLALSASQLAVSSGRQAMVSISKTWAELRSIDFRNLTPNQELEFMNFYNEQYHDANQGTSERAESNGIFHYLSSLHQLWHNVQDGTFDFDEVMKIFGDAICMDEEFLRLFLRAHRHAHPGKCFWENVPSIIEAAKTWSASQERPN